MKFLTTNYDSKGWKALDWLLVVLALAIGVYVHSWWWIGFAILGAFFTLIRPMSLFQRYTKRRLTKSFKKR